MRRVDEGRAGKSQGTGAECALIDISHFEPNFAKSSPLKNPFSLFRSTCSLQPRMLSGFRFAQLIAWSLLAACSLQLTSCSLSQDVFQKPLTVPAQHSDTTFKPHP